MLGRTKEPAAVILRTFGTKSAVNQPTDQPTKKTAVVGQFALTVAVFPHARRTHTHIHTKNCGTSAPGPRLEGNVNVREKIYHITCALHAQTLQGSSRSRTGIVQFYVC